MAPKILPLRVIGQKEMEVDRNGSLIVSVVKCVHTMKSIFTTRQDECTSVRLAIFGRTFDATSAIYQMMNWSKKKYTVIDIYFHCLEINQTIPTFPGRLML